MVDDGSTDQTAEIVESYGDQLVYLCQENQGVAAARNSGIAYAHGSFLSFLNSDDVWVVGKLSRQMALLVQNPQLDMVYGHSELFFSPEVDEAFKSRIKISQKALSSYVASAMVVRRRSFDLVGLFDSNLQAGVDIDWYSRSQEAGLLSEMLQDTVCFRRIHPVNESSHILSANKIRSLATTH